MQPNSQNRSEILTAGVHEASEGDEGTPQDLRIGAEEYGTVLKTTGKIQKRWRKDIMVRLHNGFIGMNNTCSRRTQLHQCSSFSYTFQNDMSCNRQLKSATNDKIKGRFNR